MDHETWTKAEQLIDEAMDLSGPARQAFLESRCQDPVLRAEIRSFLRCWDEMPTGFLEPAPPAELSEGELLAGTLVGPYLVVDDLGEGGMSEVFLGQDLRLHRKIALKRLRSYQHESADRALVLHEARASAQINHANVAAVYDVVEHANRAFIVMEYVEGETLSTLMYRDRLPTDRVVSIGRQIAAALVAAHTNGVIHRDIKPANIRVTPDGSVKVLDFGVSAISTTQDATADGATSGVSVGAAGTLGYMSPEQMLNRRTDERSDVFSLGLVLFEMATGEKAFRTRDRHELEAAVLQPLRRADAIKGQVSRRFADVIAKALQVEPEKRLSAVELAAALEGLHKRHFVGKVLREATNDAIATVLGQLRQGYSATRYLATFASVPAAVIVCVMGSGVLTARTFNRLLERSEFAGETLWDWSLIGLRSFVGPAAFALIALLMLTLLVLLRNVATALSPKVRRVDLAARNRILMAARWCRLDSVPVLTSSLLIVSILVLVTACWYFSPLIRAVLSHVSTASVQDLALLAPSSRSYHLLHVMVMTAVVTCLTVIWYQVARVIWRTSRPLNWWLLAGGIATTLLSVALLNLPWRVIWHSRFEAVRWNGTYCYLTGARPDDVLLLCPSLERRVVVVRKATDFLEPTGRMENVFAGFAQQ